ncbi:Predicted alpha-1,6-mannanase, GH76 family [Streptomyces sp. DvalAA-14]|nr:Predicted alpha-1,6-mannanase, GH76 family [Streptomyces sp. DvalAA-14]
MLAAASMLTGAPSAHAATLPSPDSVFQSWNDNFLVTGGNTGTYYTDELKSKGTERAGTWIGALDILVADDVYQRTRTPTDRQRVSDLVSTFLNKEGTNWTSWDGWNDDIAWMITATLEGYKATGNTSWLTTAADQWNSTFNRGWTGDGGGGIWENDTDYSKCALSNDPMISTGVGLYEITGDGTYLTKAEQIYAWMRGHVVNTSSGVVNECVAFPNGKSGSTTVQTSDNAYNAGSWIEAADDLYRATGDTSYRDDAQRTADHFMNNVPIVANNGTRGSSYQYWLFKGMSDFCTDANLCGRYSAYMNSNAAQAWSERNSANLTWNDWTKPTNDANPDAFEMNGMVALFQVLPNTAASPFSGDYQIKNATSGLSLAVQNSSTANSAPIVQGTDTTDGSTSWSFVPESNGYYEIKNTHSGQLVNISAASGKPGGLAVQWPAGSTAQGNDQWKPVRNADGTWSFYNRNSQFALDDPAGSTASGTQYEQWNPTDGSNQRFTLTSRSTGAARSAGTGPVRSGVAGKCLDLTGGNPANGAKAELWSCNGGANQSWSLAPDNTLRISGKCLDATAGGTANGTLLEIWDCTGGGNQTWQPYNGGYRNPASGRCVDDPGATTTDGTQLELWDCNGTAAQIWSLPGS